MSSTRNHTASIVRTYTAAYGTAASLQFLLDRGGSVNARITHPADSLYSGATALHAACGTTEERDEHVRLLLDAGADINATMPNGLKPLDVACRAATRSLLAGRGAVRAERTAEGVTWRFTAQMMSLTLCRQAPRAAKGCKSFHRELRRRGGTPGVWERCGSA
jgi:ankyrin repeat protein